jgi:hypothetical protein
LSWPSHRRRILDILLFPVHVAIILTRAVAGRYGWKLPGDARKEQKAERERRRLRRARLRKRKERQGARAGDREAKSGKSLERTPKDTVKVGKKKSRDGTDDRTARRRRKNRLPVAASVQGGVKP